MGTLLDMTRMRALAIPLLVAVGATALASCGGDDDDTAGGGGGDAAEITVRESLTTIDDAVGLWSTSQSIEQAHAQAEAAANLVVGPNGPGYGDRDGDGTIEGETEFGLLPGVDGTPNGLAVALADNSCVEADVLGGSWDDPAARWDEMEAVIAAWSPSDNTMPQLASHPMRLVGWATLTLASDDLDLAHEYAGHAQLHVDTALDALDCDS